MLTKFKNFVKLLIYLNKTVIILTSFIWKINKFEKYLQILHLR